MTALAEAIDAIRDLIGGATGLETIVIPALLAAQRSLPQHLLPRDMDAILVMAGQQLLAGATPLVSHQPGKRLSGETTSRV